MTADWLTNKDIYICAHSWESDCPHWRIYAARNWSEFQYINLAPSPSTRAVNSSQPNGTNMLSRNRTSSTTNPSAITSPFSPINPNSNHIDQNSQSMSPRLSGEQQTVVNTAPLSNIDSSATVSLHC